MWNGSGRRDRARGRAYYRGALRWPPFALNALLDSSASIVLVWRFRKERDDPEAAEHLRAAGADMDHRRDAAVAAYVAIEAVRALLDRSHADTTVFGVAIAAVSLAVLPPLGASKVRVARRLESQALRGDGVLTLAAAALAGITLVALLANSALDWWWADRRPRYSSLSRSPQRQPALPFATASADFMALSAVSFVT